jgi:hypothetical protein
MVLKCPQRTGLRTDEEGAEVNREGEGDCQERDASAEFGAACEFIEENKAREDYQKHSPLCKGVFSINLKKHRNLWLK